MANRLPSPSSKEQRASPAKSLKKKRSRSSNGGEAQAAETTLPIPPFDIPSNHHERYEVWTLRLPPQVEWKDLEGHKLTVTDPEDVASDDNCIQIFCVFSLI